MTSVVSPVLGNLFTNIWGAAETWAAGAEASAINFLTGLLGTVTSDQFAIIGKAATVYKAQLVAGATQTAAFTAALNELSADEKSELNTIELDFLNFLIQLSGTVPTLAGSVN